MFKAKAFIVAPIWIFLFVGLQLGCSSQTDDETGNMSKEQVGLIGYGSLMSRPSMERTLGRPYDGAIRKIHLQGYQRLWNIKVPNTGEGAYTCMTETGTIIPESLIFLNIQPKEEQSMNCCLYILEEADLVAFDAREIGYQRIEVSRDIVETDIPDLPIYAYKALPAFIAEAEENNPGKNAVLLQYLEILDNAFDVLGATFEQEFQASTLPLDPDLVLDCTLDL
ncbi:gamma-glutamylcyclotransferase family protein [Flavobacteriaceae bacterium 3-367]